MERGKGLRSGFTTGTCAAAAAGAAAALLCGGQAPPFMEVATPAGTAACLAVERVEYWPGIKAKCAVRKDAGDDPDVTNGAWIYASVCFLDSRPAPSPWYEDEEKRGLYLTGGEGIGLVTKRGLSCPVGYPAINPVPRAMIFRETARAREQAGMNGLSMLIEISIPAGTELAARTFNPQLGIEGGISILGTSGIVNPMSEEALLETIRLEIRVKAAEGRRMLAVAPGNYGERFLREEAGLSMEAFVKCSNFIGDTFRMMREEGIRRALLAGHVGKLVKVAGGVLNTHSRYGDRRMEILSACAEEAGASREEAGAILKMNTTEEAAGYLDFLGILAPVMKITAERVKQTLEAAGDVETEVFLFSERFGLLAGTDRAKEFAARLRENGRAEAGGHLL